MGFCVQSLSTNDGDSFSCVTSNKRFFAFRHGRSTAAAAAEFRLYSETSSETCTSQCRHAEELLLLLVKICYVRGRLSIEVFISPS